MVDDPKSRQALIDSLKEALSKGMSPEEQAAHNIVINLLQKKGLTSKNFAGAVTKLAAAEAKGQVVGAVQEEVAVQVASELGLSAIDPTGITNAIGIIRAISKGDMDALANNLAILLAVKFAAALLCSVM